MECNPYAYLESKELAKRDWQFDALIMAAMRKADTQNLELIKNAWPGTYEYFKHCYNCAGCDECHRKNA